MSPFAARFGPAGWRGVLPYAGLLVLVLLLGAGLGRLWLHFYPPGPPPPTPRQMLAAPQTIPETVVVTAADQPASTTPPLLPAEAPQLYCRYRFDDRAAGTPFTVSWRLNGKDLGAVALAEHRPERGAVLAGRFLLKPPAGAKQFAPGLYQLLFRSGDAELVEASFVLARQAAQILAPQAPPVGALRVVSCATFAYLDPQGKPQVPCKHFGPTDRVAVAFAYLGAPKGAQLEIRWLSRGEVLPQATSRVTATPGPGQSYAWLQAAGEGLPEGEYEVQIWPLLPPAPAAPPARATPATPAAAPRPPVPVPVPAPGPAAAASPSPVPSAADTPPSPAASTRFLVGKGITVPPPPAPPPGSAAPPGAPAARPPAPPAAPRR